MTITTTAPTLDRISRTPRTFTKADVAAFRDICSQVVDKAAYPLSTSVASNVLIYFGPTLRSLCASEQRDAVMAELHRALYSGPGVLVIEDCFDVRVVDRASSAFDAIIEREKAQGKAKGDHFAPAGKNERIWNSFQKHATTDPASFVEYYANPVLALVCEAWLGPGYSVTAQTNVVKPGGRAQEPHRDYHLGFQDQATAARFPLVSQVASQLLTLQGAVAHTDMPVQSGPTLLLPFSHTYAHGYEAYRHPEFAEVFREMRVQLPLKKGDALFFNPALFHAAGDNDTEDIRRAANLLQVSACWGKPMESVDRLAILKQTWSHIQAFASGKTGRVPDQIEVDALLAAVADGYSFPTNLDRDPPPPSGHCPLTQLDVARDALQSGADQEAAGRAFHEQAEKHLP